MFVVVAAAVVYAANHHPLSRRMHLINHSGEKVAIDWMDPRTGKLHTLTETSHGQDIEFDSFVNHTFFVHGSSASTCNDTSSQECAGAYVTVHSDTAPQHIVIERGMAIHRQEEDDDDDVLSASTLHALAQPGQEAEAIVQICREKASHLLQTTQRPMARIMDTLTDCLKEETARILMIKHEEVAFQADLRTRISAMAENYTCSDPTLETTAPLNIRTWMHGGRAHTVHILHERPSSNIHVVHNFIQPHECEAIRLAAQSTLHRGTVADGKGGSRLSESRKAWQAGIKVDYDKQDNPIADVSRRLFAYANDVTGYNMTLDGQEDIMSIQYFGDGVANPTPDRYMPHCDGTCDGTPHKRGGRVATMVMYCDVPELGGATNFQNSNVYVKPKLGAAAFFSYLDPKSYLHEQGFTTHSGCPVLLGTKRIAVQWMRIGVDNDNPWDSFDTNTIQIREKENSEEDEEGDYDDDADFVDDDE
jgi:hypothetical protein